MGRGGVITSAEVGGDEHFGSILHGTPVSQVMSGPNFSGFWMKQFHVTTSSTPYSTVTLSRCLTEQWATSRRRSPLTTTKYFRDTLQRRSASNNTINSTGTNGNSESNSSNRDVHGDGLGDNQQPHKHPRPLISFPLRLLVVELSVQL